MIRRMKQWAAILIMACMMAVVMPGQMLTAFAAGAKITFSDPSAKVGSEFKVNMKVTNSGKLSNVDIMLAYDSNALEFVSGTNAEGGAGAVRVHGDGGTPGTGTMTFTLQFKALASGSSKITVTSQEIYDGNSKLVTVDHQGDSTVTVSALQTASKDATLKSLKVSPGELSPAFSPDVDTYAVTVGTDVDKLVISADTADENATMVISGNEGLQMGENRVTCKVTAQDGETTKEYVIAVTKQDGGESTAAPAAADSTDSDADQQVKMEISRRTITILPPDDSVKVPEGFKPTTINIDGHKVKGWVWGADKDPQYCVVYGMNEAGEKNLYRYDMKDTERTIQRYFEDPVASDMVTPDQYNALAVQYDKVRQDFNLFRILLAAAVAIAVVLLIILLVVLLSRKDKGGGGPSGSKDGRNRPSSRQKKQSGFRDGERLENGEDYDQEYADEDRYEDAAGGGYTDADGGGYTDADGGREENRYSGRGGYREEDRYEEPGGYDEEDRYADQDGYGEEDRYADQSGYGEEDQYADQSGYRGEDRYAGRGAYREETGYAGRGPYREETGYADPAFGRTDAGSAGPRRQPAAQARPSRQAQPPVPPARGIRPDRTAPSPDASPGGEDDDFELFDL